MPHREPLAYLWDIKTATRAIQSFTHNMNEAEYCADELVQAAVERKFAIIGEALNQLSKIDADVTNRIPDVPQIIAFRNQIVHGYTNIRPRTVWHILQTALPDLAASTEKEEARLLDR